jgi:hypothetical protein
LPVVHDSSIVGIVTTGRILSNISIEKHADRDKVLNNFGYIDDNLSTLNLLGG